VAAAAVGAAVAEEVEEELAEAEAAGVVFAGGSPEAEGLAEEDRAVGISAARSEVETGLRLCRPGTLAGIGPTWVNRVVGIDPTSVDRVAIVPESGMAVASRIARGSAIGQGTAIAPESATDRAAAIDPESTIVRESVIVPELETAAESATGIAAIGPTIGTITGKTCTTTGTTARGAGIGVMVPVIGTTIPGRLGASPRPPSA